MQFAATILTLILCCGYVFLLARKRSPLLSIGLFFVIELIWMFVSIAYIDCGTYILEQERYSYFTGASIRLLLVYFPFLFFLPRFIRRGVKKYESYYGVSLSPINVKSKYVHKAAQALLFLVVTYGMVDMLLVGVPLFSTTVTRSTFFSFSKLPGASLLMGEVTFFLMFLNGKHFVETTKRSEKLLCLTLLGYSVAHRLLMAYKYDGLYQIFFTFFLYALFHWIATLTWKKVFSLKTVLIVGVSLCACLGLVVLIYSLKNTSHNPVELLMQRLFGLQTHTWWGEDLRHITQSEYWFNWSQIKRELSVLFTGNGAYDSGTGIVNVMYHVTRPDVVQEYVSNSLRFYGNFATVSLNCFGYTGTALWGVAVAGMISFTISNTVASFKERQWISTYLSLSLLWDVFEYFRVGNFYLIFNVKTILLFFLLVTMNFLKRRKYKRMQHLKEVTPAELEKVELPEDLKISICMCTYNGSAYVREQLDSLLAQTRLPNEIVVFDDASTDDTVAILEEYKANNPHVVWDIHPNKTNQGWRTNFKLALEQTDGDIIFLCDQDDIWMPDKLMTMSRALVRNPEIRLLVSDYEPFYMDGSIDHDIEVETYGTCRVTPIKPDEKLMYCMRPGCTHALTRAALPDFFACWQSDFAHDALLWRTACLRHALYRIDYASIRFRRHNSNASSSGHGRISAAEYMEIRKGIDMYIDCVTKMQALDLPQKEQRLLADLRVWLDKRNALYRKPSPFRLIGLLRYLRFYKQFRVYVKEVNAILYRSEGGKYESRKVH